MTATTWKMRKMTSLQVGDDFFLSTINLFRVSFRDTKIIVKLYPS